MLPTVHKHSALSVILSTDNGQQLLWNNFRPDTR